MARAAQTLLVIALAIAGTYWFWFSPVLVERTAIADGDVRAEVMGTGTLEARNSATVSSKIAGRIVEVLVDQGDRATAGQVVARLDDVDFQRQVEASESTVAAARDALRRQTAERTRSLAVLEMAEIDFRRVKNLAASNAAASQEMDKATEALHVAQADVQRSEAALAEAASQILIAKRTLEFQKARLADTVITAPFAGLIARRDLDRGNVVVPGTSILYLLSTDEMWISAWVDETEMARLALGQPARVVFRSEPQHDYDGEVARLGREVDRETREFVVDVRVRELPPNWAVGQRAEVYIETGRNADALCLPTRMIVWRDGQPGTFVEADGRAEWRTLQLGLRGREFVEIIQGLSAGDPVIAPANPKTGGLMHGQRVTPVAESGSIAAGGRK